MRLPAVLHEREYRLLFGAQLASLLGDQMVTVALAFGILDHGGSASDVGIVLAARSLAVIAFLLGGGVIGDRLPRRAVLIATDVVRIGSQGAVAAVLISGNGSIALLAALSAVTGAATGVFNPTATGFLPEVVSAEGLQEANALRSLASSGGRIAGPLLAGLLVATAGAGWAIAVDAASYAVSAALVAAMAVRGAGRAAGATESFLDELRTGWTAFRSMTWLVAIVASAAVGNLCNGAWKVLGPVVAKTELGGVGAWSAIVAAAGAGGVLGGLFALRLAPRRPLVFMTCAVGAFFVQFALLAVVAPTAIIAAAAFVGEVGMVLGMTVWESTMQRHVEARLLSRVSAYDWLGSLVFEPIGLAIWGPVAAATSTATALWIAFALGVTSLFAPLLVRAVRDLPAEPAPTARA
ncbi:MFS transporter [Conexibacter woesei]|uniref:MFS transporter n=1 Tax=Conexibacter woesei TaxID=191495 RepID=UPI0004131A75|nr:MFS transporter [Conexibacter woesei]